MSGDFQKNMDELKDAVAKLGQDDVSLEEAITLYKKGIKAAEKAEKILSDTEKEIEILSANESESM